MAGIVVKHKATGNVYAISEENLDKTTETKVRDLKAGESPLDFPHKAQTDPKPTKTTNPTNPSVRNITPKENK